jgi:hypothetical protein
MEQGRRRFFHNIGCAHTIATYQFVISCCSTHQQKQGNWWTFRKTSFGILMLYNSFWIYTRRCILQLEWGMWREHIWLQCHSNEISLWKLSCTWEQVNLKWNKNLKCVNNINKRRLHLTLAFMLMFGSSEWSTTFLLEP